VLVWLHKIEVAAIAFREPIVTVELEFGSGNRVGTAFEGYWEIHTVGTTSGNTWHGAYIGIRVVDKDVG